MATWLPAGVGSRTEGLIYGKVRCARFNWNGPSCCQIHAEVPGHGTINNRLSRELQLPTLCVLEIQRNCDKLGFRAMHLTPVNQSPVVVMRLMRNMLGCPMPTRGQQESCA